MMLLTLLGCGGEPTCAAGFSPGDDGLCYQDVAPGVDLAGLSVDLLESEVDTTRPPDLS